MPLPAFLALLPSSFTFDRALKVWIALSVVVGIILLVREEIPRGSKRSNRSKLAVDTRLGWILKELPGTAQLIYWFARPGAAPVPVARVFFMAYLVHYTYRIVVYPFLLRTGGRKNITVENLLHTAWWHLMNEGLIGFWLTERCDYSTSWLTDPRFVLGWILFSAGLAVCISHDCFLIALRREGDPRGSVRVPEGGLFAYVANGNYLGECVEWLGFAILTWSWVGLAFFIWSCANLVPTAIANDRWYRRELKGAKGEKNGLQTMPYPAHRKAIIPGLL
eukprot:g1320.t1